MEYLNRAKKLRAMAEEMHDLRARNAIIGFAESYERMASSLTEAGAYNSVMRPPSKNSLVAGFVLAFSQAVAMFIRFSHVISIRLRRPATTDGP